MIMFNNDLLNSHCFDIIYYEPDKKHKALLL